MKEEEKTTKTRTLYPYQQADLETIFDRMSNRQQNYRLLYQLPTGGGKTVVFSEIVRRYTGIYNKKAIVLTHRQELCNQTARTLKILGVKSKAITSIVKKIPLINEYFCFVAMVETLKNRLEQNKFSPRDIGLVIIDEAHHNSFRKLLGNFPDAFVIGVTATPLSSDPDQPLKSDYDELIVGESIPSLIEKGFLARAETFGHQVDLNGLRTGEAGDFTMQSSDELYSSQAMLDLLLQSYESKAKGKKTLIFNNGIIASKKVCDAFQQAGYPIRHLDNNTPSKERAEILSWFKKTRGSIVTSVSILTTGFDEPSVQAVIINRATKSMTLYFQMIGRASRKTRSKKLFTIIDLGNNVERFGNWSDPVDWLDVFDNPEKYAYANLDSESSGSSYHLPAEIRAMFPKTTNFAFDIEQAYKEAIETDKKPKAAIQNSIRQHAMICLANADTISEACKLAGHLEPEIIHRVKIYTKLLDKTTKSYRDWLIDDYKQRLNTLIAKIFNKIDVEPDQQLVTL